MTEFIAGVEIPRRMARLPRDSVGRPVPWFVAWVDGKPDFRLMAEGKIEKGHAEHRCWTCGAKITGPTMAFVIGPMCAVNRISAEPPSHRECAEFSARACPFLNNPNKVRREGNIPDSAVNPAGEMIRRNPGVTLVWITTSYKVVPADGGVLFNIGTPVHARWFAEGREATRDGVLASIDSGLPILQKMADDEGDGAPEQLADMHAAALELVPA